MLATFGLEKNNDKQPYNYIYLCLVAISRYKADFCLISILGEIKFKVDIWDGTTPALNQVIDCTQMTRRLKIPS